MAEPTASATLAERFRQDDQDRVFVHPIKSSVRPLRAGCAACLPVTRAGPARAGAFAHRPRVAGAHDARHGRDHQSPCVMHARDAPAAARVGGWEGGGLSQAVCGGARSGPGVLLSAHARVGGVFPPAARAAATSGARATALQDRCGRCGRCCAAHLRPCCAGQPASPATRCWRPRLRSSCTSCRSGLTSRWGLARDGVRQDGTAGALGTCVQGDPKWIPSASDLFSAALLLGADPLVCMQLRPAGTPLTNTFVSLDSDAATPTVVTGSPRGNQDFSADDAQRLIGLRALFISAADAAPRLRCAREGGALAGRRMVAHLHATRAVLPTVLPCCRSLSAACSTPWCWARGSGWTPRRRCGAHAPPGSRSAARHS
jgi:hypothetical protein